MPHPIHPAPREPPRRSRARSMRCAAAAAANVRTAASLCRLSPPPNVAAPRSLVVRASLAAVVPQVVPQRHHHQQTAAALGASSSRAARQARCGARTMATAPDVSGAITVPPGQEVAVLGGGCFWCLDACYRMLKGVSAVHSGYAGGHVESPTYEQVCGKQTGHAEVVAVAYDPAVITFRDLLDVFFTIHDPTTPNRQGADVGPQYRSIILYTDEQQKEVAQQAIADVTAQGLYDAPIVTELVPLTKLWPGESYHQDYFSTNPSAGYCRAVVGPKVAKFRSKYIKKLLA